MLDLIFVHVAKAGGGALHNVLRHKYGTALLRDYGDKIGNPDSETIRDPITFLARDHVSALEGKRAVIGHFWIEKYRGAEARIRATILREPISRVLSGYFYWRTLPPQPGFELHRKVAAGEMTFTQFCEEPIIHANYTKVLFKEVDMGQFSYIGDYEEYKNDWAGTMARIGIEAERETSHVTSDGAKHYALHKERIFNDPKAMARLRRLFADDIDFYEHWTASRELGASI